MDVSSPRRIPLRNSNNPAATAHHEPPYLHGSPKHLEGFTHTPTPPIPLHQRAMNESWDPQPNDDWNTPASSPRKQNAARLAELFDKQLQLSPSTSPAPPEAATPPPGKRALRAKGEGDSNANASVIRLDKAREAAERKEARNKENSSVTSSDREGRKSTSATGSRTHGTGGRKKYNPMDELTMEDLEKLGKPQVKRLKDVAHLYFYDYYYNLVTYVHTRQSRTEQWKAAQQGKPSEEVAQQWKRFAGRERVALRKRRTRLRKGDFQLLTQVGQGGYGQVYLAEHKDTKEVCALKVMSKKLLFKLDEIRHVLTERDILTAAKSDWLVKLLYAFQDDESIYLAMEYVPGGDFRTLLNNTGVLHFPHARFYISEMFTSVNALHDLGYIHRDLKPENFLIDGTGHIKLTDFGLSAGKLAPERMESMKMKLEQVKDMNIPERSTMERRKAYRTLRDADRNYAKSVVGSPDYMAPEVLRGEPYDFSVDYWSLGCMLYEALAGYPPFAGATVEETWHNLKHWRKVFHKPEYEDPNYYLSKRTWDFITRLVAGRNARFPDFKSVQQHVYFAEVNWDNLRAKDPPFVPELDSETDAGYFDDFSNEADMAKYKEVHDKQAALENMAERDGKLDRAAFLGFTFK
ncbi:kinase-like domain-containing protein [Pyronema omphalodes]|nr:kinase-like domain-containing protein [Pyronema omphalodes]